MYKSILKKAICSLLVCCQVFAFSMVPKADNKPGDITISPMNIHEEQKKDN